MTSAKKWLGVLGNLNVSRSKTKGSAPNKPLLLLAIVDLVEAGRVGADGLIAKDAELVFHFRSYTQICVKRRGNKIDLDLPFRHLASDGIYSLVGQGEQLVRLNTELLSLLADSAFRLQVRKILVSTYFPANEQVGLCAALGVSTLTAGEIAEIREDADKYQAQMKVGRDAYFKVSVMSGYHFTCALTGYRITTNKEFNLVEAAHIWSHAEKGPDVAENGLALTPTAHRLFDAGLWSVKNDFTIIVAEDKFKERPLARSNHFRLADLRGRTLSFDSAAKLRPGKEYLAWHREKVFGIKG